MNHTSKRLPGLFLLLAAFLVVTSLACQAVSNLGRQPQPPTSATEAVLPSQNPANPEQPAGTPTPIGKDMQMRVFEDLWQTVHDIYLYPDFKGLDWDAVHVEYGQKIKAGMSDEDFYAAMKEMINRLGDNHSQYLTPEEAKTQAEEMAGSYNYVGIGVFLSVSNDGQRAVVLFVFPDSPAEKAGLKARDNILSANGEPIIDEQGGIKTIIRGPEGTTVDVEVQSPGETPRVITITRGAISSNVALPHTVLTTPQGKRIGYIFLFTFNNSTIPDLFGDALKEMSANGPLDGLIIDDRENGGGSIAAMTDTLAYFISGQAGSFYNRERDEPLNIIRPQNIGGSQNYPLVVLIGEGSFSAGELFPGILQDLGRAYLIGQTTNGVVETKYIYSFEDGSEAEISAEAFRPLNHPDTTWQDVGVKPDLEAENAWDQYPVEQEPAVLAALKYFDEK